MITKIYEMDFLNYSQGKAKKKEEQDHKYSGSALLGHL